MRDPKPHSVVATWATAAVLVAPLCGASFGCGCDWPWAKFFWACNAIVHNTPPPHCPWCTHPLTAILSIGISLAAGTWATRKLPASFSSGAAEILYRSSFGVAGFVGALLLGAWLTALATA